eukprot:jgi/Psemu1/60572/gm1.60572_g
MPATAFDWNQIQDIAIQFGTFNAKGNAHKHEDLNKTSAHILEYTDGLFITDDDADSDSEGPKTLAPDPVTMLRKIIVKAIMDIIPSKERTAVNKGHISRLFADATFWYAAPNKSTKRLRNNHWMDKAGELAIENGQDTILIEIRATHWGFKPDWDAIHFAEVYDTNIYSFPKKSNTRKATTVADKTPNASRARFANLPQRKYIKPKAVPLQREHIKPQAVPPNTANLDSLQPVGPIANTPSAKAPRYIWTWTYFPNSELVSFRQRVQSDSVSCKRASSFSPPVQQQDKFPVTAPSVKPSALTKSGHHYAPPWKPPNLRWPFNYQSETVLVFHPLPKPASTPLKPSLQFQLPKAIHEGTILASAIPTFAKPSAYSSLFHCETYSHPNQTVFCITKRHRDALKIKMYHLYANILSMNWFYYTFD